MKNKKNPTPDRQNYLLSCLEFCKLYVTDKTYKTLSLRDERKQQQKNLNNLGEKQTKATYF